MSLKLSMPSAILCRRNFVVQVHIIAFHIAIALSFYRQLPTSLLCHVERVLDLFAAVEGRNEDEQGSACNNQAERSRRFVSFVVYAELASLGSLEVASLPLMSSLTSSNTRFMS
jgi:hypothetical protein